MCRLRVIPDSTISSDKHNSVTSVDFKFSSSTLVSFPIFLGRKKQQQGNIFLNVLSFW